MTPSLVVPRDSDLSLGAEFGICGQAESTASSLTSSDSRETFDWPSARPPWLTSRGGSREALLALPDRSLSDSRHSGFCFVPLRWSCASRGRLLPSHVRIATDPQRPKLFAQLRHI